MKIPILNTEQIEQLRSFFHPKDRSVILADDTFIEGEEVTTPANPRHNRGRLYWKNGCWTQLDESGNESTLCNGIWQNWTPTITQGVAVTVTVNRARYIRIGSTVHIMADLTATSAGTAGSTIIISGVPIAAWVATGILAGDVTTLGTCCVFDVGTQVYYGFLVALTTSTFRLRDSNTRGVIGNNPNFALANTDVITFRGTYEGA